MLNHSLFNREGRSAPLADLRREMDRLFEDFWAPVTSSSRTLGSEWQPACDIDESEDHFLLSLEMAGVPKEQIRIEVAGNELVISGERSRQTKRKQESQSYSERRFGKFQRSFALPSAVDSARIEADYQDGILRVWVPKAESSKPRQVKIGTGTGSSFFGKLLGEKNGRASEPGRVTETGKAEQVA
jgi:HSP20 family protein